jgi:hypothetical protein
MDSSSSMPCSSCLSISWAFGTISVIALVVYAMVEIFG